MRNLLLYDYNFHWSYTAQSLVVVRLKLNIGLVKKF